MADKYLIGETLREKLRTTIAKVEGLPLGGGTSRIPTDLSGDVPSASKAFRICTFTGSWAINSSKSVTLKNVPTTPNTVMASNVYAGVGAGDGVIAKEGTAWYLISVDLTKQPGYSSGGTQVLAVVNGTLNWIGTTACA
jgi:hypothetical protein